MKTIVDETIREGDVISHGTDQRKLVVHGYDPASGLVSLVHVVGYKKKDDAIAARSKERSKPTEHPSSATLSDLVAHGWYYKARGDEKKRVETPAAAPKSTEDIHAEILRLADIAAHEDTDHRGRYEANDAIDAKIVELRKTDPEGARAILQKLMERAGISDD